MKKDWSGRWLLLASPRSGIRTRSRLIFGGRTPIFLGRKRLPWWERPRQRPRPRHLPLCFILRSALGQPAHRPLWTWHVAERRKDGVDPGIDSARLAKVLAMTNEIRVKYAHAPLLN